MAAPFPEELNTEASFDHASLQKTPTQRKPRQKKSYGGLQAGPSSSPIARRQSGLTPPKTIRKRTVSTGSARAGLANPECDRSLPLAQDTASHGATSPPRAKSSTTPPRPTLDPERRPHTDPATPRAQSKTPARATPLRFVSAPLPSTSQGRAHDRIIELLQCGPRTLSKKGTYNYLFVLKKPGTDEPGMLKIGITNNINRRISAIKSDCKYNEIQELPGGISYTGKLAAVAEALMLAELDAQKCLVNCCPKKTHTHTDRFEMANMDIVTEVFHRWLDFCSLAPWDDKGKLKPRWLARLDAHRQNFDTRGPEGHRNRLNVDWKSFVNVSLRQKLVHDLSTVSKEKNLFSWQLTALVEATIIFCLTLPSFFAFFWSVGWAFIFWLKPLGASLDYDDLWIDFSLGQIPTFWLHWSLYRWDTFSFWYSSAKGMTPEVDGISTRSGSSISRCLRSGEGDTTGGPADVVRRNSGSPEGQFEDGAASYDETAIDAITVDDMILDNENEGDTGTSSTDHSDADEMDIDQEDHHDGQHRDTEFREISSAFSQSIGERKPKGGDGSRDSPITIPDSEDETLPELPEASVTYSLPPISSMPAYRLGVSSSADLVEQAA